MATKKELNKKLTDAQKTLDQMKADRKAGKKVDEGKYKRQIDVVNGLNDRGVQIQSLQESIDTATPSGKLFFHLTASLSEFERDVIRQRTRAGLEAARSRGRVGGRPPAMDGKTLAMARQLLNQPGARVKDVAQALSVSRATIYRNLGKL